MNHALNNKIVSCFIQKHSAAKLLPTRQLRNVLHRLKFLNAITAFTPLTVFPFNHLQPTKSIYREPVQGSNLSRRYISGLETEMPVTKPSQSSNWGAETRTKCKSTSPCLLAIPAFDRKAGLNNRHLNSNRGICLR
jgi:hypothetical protein